jgi:hypothetical protein
VVQEPGVLSEKVNEDATVGKNQFRMVQKDNIVEEILIQEVQEDKSVSYQENLDVVVKFTSGSCRR